MGKLESKYSKRIGKEMVDVYDVLMAFNVTNPATQHAIKKLLMPGNRGHKDKLCLLYTSDAADE